MKTPWWDSVGGFVTDDGRWGQGIRRWWVVEWWVVNRKVEFGGEVEKVFPLPAYRLYSTRMHNFRPNPNPVIGPKDGGAYPRSHSRRKRLEKMAARCADLHDHILGSSASKRWRRVAPPSAQVNASFVFVIKKKKKKKNRICDLPLKKRQKV